MGARLSPVGGGAGWLSRRGGFAAVTLPALFVHGGGRRVTKVTTTNWDD